MSEHPELQTIRRALEAAQNCHLQLQNLLIARAAVAPAKSAIEGVIRDLERVDRMLSTDEARAQTLGAATL
jgi:hypothetical protein